MIWKHFVMVNDSDEAVDQVADASFAFYENTYFLKEALVKRQLRFQMLSSRNFTSNQTQQAKDLAKQDRSLHIMNDCIINMPVSIGKWILGYRSGFLNVIVKYNPRIKTENVLNNFTFYFFLIWI